MPIPRVGTWFSWIDRVPPSLPNEGYFTISEPDPNTGAFMGVHHQPSGDFDIRGTYTFRAATPANPDHIEFSGDQLATQSTLSYRGDVIEIGNVLTVIPGTGKRHRAPLPDPNAKRGGKPAPPDANPDDDWTGTHTT